MTSPLRAIRMVLIKLGQTVATMQIADCRKQVSFVTDVDCSRFWTLSVSASGSGAPCCATAPFGLVEAERVRTAVAGILADEANSSDKFANLSWPNGVCVAVARALYNKSHQREVDVSIVCSTVVSAKGRIVEWKPHSSAPAAKVNL